MSKLDELIKELCPDGVEYKKLTDACTIKRGIRVVRNQLKQTGEFPVFQNSLTPMGYHDKSNCPANTSFVIVAGAAGDVGYSESKFWAADDCFYFSCPETLSSRYLYYVLMSQQIYLYSKVRKASIPRLSRNFIEDLRIPVPPLPVQREIVRILDNFSERTAELTEQLTAELTARRRQYEYYRDKLLTFDVLGGGASDCIWRTLGEVCYLKAGKAISAYEISSEKTAVYSVPCFGGNGLRGYVRVANQQGDKPLIGRQGALCGNVCYATDDYYATEHAVVVTDKGYFNSRFLYHVLVQKDLNQYKTAGAQPGLSVAKLKTISVPVPDISIQNKLVRILDDFDALCNDLTSGLPAEIAARQKQYEYYRDKLLSFKEFGCV